MLARAVMRTSRARAALLLVVLVVSVGFGLFAATGARRTSSALDRFISWSRPASIETGGGAGDTPVGSRLDEVAALAPVLQSQRNRSIGIHGVEIHGAVVPPMRFAVVAFEPGAEDFDRVRVLRGQISEDAAPDQGFIDFVTAERLDLDLGDTVTVLAASGPDGQDTLELPIEVTAVVTSPRVLPTLAGYSFNALAVGPRFVEAHPEMVDPWAESLSIRLRGGPGAVDEMRLAMEEAGLGDIDLIDALGPVQVGADRLFSLEASAMWLAAALAFAVGVPVAYQLLRRDAAANRTTIETLLALGASRRQLAAGAMARGAAIAVVAGSLGTTAAVLASPLSPVGMARNAEPDPGVWVDWTVLVLSVPLFVVAVAAAAAAAMWSAIRPAAQHEVARTSRWLGARVPVAVGIGMGRGGRGASLGIGANVVVTLLVVGMVVAAGSLEAVPRDASLSGGVWDAWFSTAPHAADDVDEMLDALPVVRAHGSGGWFELQAGPDYLYTIALPRLPGMEPAIVRGRGPRTDDEVALGARAMERLGVGIGDSFTAEVSGRDDPPLHLTVTGEMIVAAPLFQTHAPDDAALVAFDLSDVFDLEGHRAELVRFAGDAEAEPTMDAIVEQAPEGSFDFYFARGQRGDVVALQRLQWLVRALLLLAATLSLASIVHHLLVTHRHHRQGLAVLRALGFTRGDAAAAGAISGLTGTVLMVLVAVPLGLAAGSVAWRYLAAELVILPRTSIETRLLVAGILATLVAASALALMLARRSANRPIAESLKAE